METDLYRGTVNVRGRNGNDNAIVVIGDETRDVCQKVVQLITGEYEGSLHVHRPYTRGQVLPSHNPQDSVFDTYEGIEPDRFGSFPKLPEVTLSAKQAKYVKQYQST